MGTSECRLHTRVESNRVEPSLPLGLFCSIVSSFHFLCGHTNPILHHCSPLTLRTGAVLSRFARTVHQAPGDRHPSLSKPPSEPPSHLPPPPSHQSHRITHNLASPSATLHCTAPHYYTTTPRSTALIPIKIKLRPTLPFPSPLLLLCLVCT